MDLESGVAEFETASGAVVRERMPSSLREAGTNIRRLTVDVEADKLVAVLPSGVEAHVELGVTGSAPPTRSPAAAWYTSTRIAGGHGRLAPWAQADQRRRSGG